ncbi:hypothetical protein REPUB_Repub09cG0081100 [Reevesia pubescens]
MEKQKSCRVDIEKQLSSIGTGECRKSGESQERRCLGGMSGIFIIGGHCFSIVDTYFKTYLSCRNDLLLSNKILEDDGPFSKNAVLQILRVVQTILENCHNKSSFDGLECSLVNARDTMMTGYIPKRGLSSKKYVPAMNEAIVSLANAVKELLRHVSSLRSSGVDIIMKL